MRAIHHRYRRIERAKTRVGSDKFISRAHKKTRDWHVLGAVQKLLRTAGLEAPEFAAEREGPDFQTYRPDGMADGLVEVVEVLVPGYKRQAIGRGVWQPVVSHFNGMPEPLLEPWWPLREQISRAATQTWPAGTSLVIYYDIGTMSFDDWTIPFHQQLLAEHARTPFAGLENFARVLVMSSDARSLVQLHPSVEVIVREEDDCPLES